MTKDARTRQSELRMRKQANDFRHKNFWVSPAEDMALRKKFPGHSGGIRWCDVVRAALSAEPRW